MYVTRTSVRRSRRRLSRIRSLLSCLVDARRSPASEISHSASGSVSGLQELIEHGAVGGLEGVRPFDFDESRQGADSGGSRPRIRDDVAHHSDLISLGVPR
jgi:hypothetical protein